MAFLDFLTDTWGALSGGNAPQLQYNTLSPQQGLSQSYGILQGLLPQYTTLNQDKAKADTATQLDVENQVYGPQANQLRQESYQSLLDTLRQPISQEIEADILRNAFQKTPLGGMQAGRYNASVFTGLQKKALQDQATQAALGGVYRLPTSSYQYQPTALPDVGGIYGQLQQQNQRENEIENENRMIDAQNTQKNLQFGVKLAAIGAGIAFPPLGAAMLGGSMLGGIGGPQQGIGGQGGMGNILSIFSRPPPSVATSGFPIGSDQYSDPNAPMFRAVRR